LVLLGLAVALPAGAQPLTGSPGATVGGIVGAIMLVTLGVAVWPQPWSSQEERHHECDTIWHEVRGDAEVEVGWTRFAAWVTADGDSLRLQLLRREPSAQRVRGAPSPYSFEQVRSIPAEDIALAAEAMEQLRADAQSREESSRQQMAENLDRAERLALKRTLRGIDDASEAEISRREEALREEVAAQESAERRAQAEAVARSLRRP